MINRLSSHSGSSNRFFIKKQQSPIVEITNLLVDLDAGNVSSYPGSGSTWTNLVNNENFTIYNGTFNSSNGGSIVFNNTTYVPVGSPLQSGTNYTKELWVMSNISTGSRNMLSSENNVLWCNMSTLYGGVGGEYMSVNGGTFPLNVWKHVTLTFNDSINTMKIYLDGNLISQNTNVTTSYISETLRIGSHFSSSPISFWSGKISKVKIYDNVLTDGEILTNFNTDKNRFGL